MEANKKDKGVAKRLERYGRSQSNNIHMNGFINFMDSTGLIGPSPLK